MGTNVLMRFGGRLQQKTAIQFNKAELRFEFRQWVRAVDVPHSGRCLVLILRIFLMVADLLVRPDAARTYRKYVSAKYTTCFKKYPRNQYPDQETEHYYNC